MSPSKALRKSALQASNSIELRQNAAKTKLIVGISGASGAIYGIRLLQVLAAGPVETHLVMSRSARLTLALETDWRVRDVERLAGASYAPDDIGAAIASGSFATLGMVVAPCSTRSLAEVASGVTSTLLTRAADVVLKERRRLVMLVRETPLHLGHLRNMTAVTEMGAVVMPPVPAFYARPRSLEDLVDQTVGRALDLLGIDNDLVRRWRGTREEVAALPHDGTSSASALPHDGTSSASALPHGRRGIGRRSNKLR